MWDLPGPGLDPVSPALAGGFLTTVPPGKPESCILNLHFYYEIEHFFGLCISLSVYHLYISEEEYFEKDVF